MSSLEHTLGKSWIYTFMTLRARASNFNMTFENEPKEFLPIVQPDQFITLNLRPFFCEFNRHESGNRFTKIAQYNQLAEKLIKEKSKGLKPHWWIDLDKEQNFTVLIVTTGHTEPLQAIIDKEKAFPYLIELISLEGLIRFCYSLHNARKGEGKCLKQQSHCSLSSE
jgi:hypothetical protein